MKRLIRTTVVALLLGGSLVAFRGAGPNQQVPPAPKNNQTPRNIQAPANNRQPFRDADTLGREVDIDSARRCIKLYAALVEKRKLTEREEKLYPNFRRSRVNTTGEVFSGRKLLAWLQSTDSLYSAQGLAMHLNVQLGLYTEDYLQTYHPADKRLQKKLLGRVGIFMIPVDSVSKWSIDRDGKLSPDQERKLYSKASLQHGPAAMPAALTEAAGAAYYGGQGGKGYDLGGIQP